jgi:predicted ribosome quality control (RQC) complex YloA/Tae2 family protein
MSLNWKEINLVLEELSLEGFQIQNAVQSTFDIIILRIHKKGETRQILVSLSPGACRLHETFKAVPKTGKTLRFAQFLNSKIVNGWITEAVQLADNRIVRITVKRFETEYRLYIRLWSNAANFIVTGEKGAILDAMRRLPKKGEITGGCYTPELSVYAELMPQKQANDGIINTAAIHKPEREKREYQIREFPGEGSFSKKIDDFYAEQGGSLSLEALREQAKKSCEMSVNRISAALEKLREKEISFINASRLKVYGDLILSNIRLIKKGDKYLELEDGGAAVTDQGLSTNAKVPVRIELDPLADPVSQAGRYYELYKKAKSGLSDIQDEIKSGQQELLRINERLEKLLLETNPLILAKMLKSGAALKSAVSSVSKKEKNRPGLTFVQKDWTIIVGRDANENDTLLRRHVKGNDIWLHARDYHGSYVFIRQRSGKSVPLDILLDAGNLAIFYSKGRNNAEGDLFYTLVKYLRRAKNGPKGLVIPTQEKNLHVKVDEKRLRVLESCRVLT